MILALRLWKIFLITVTVTVWLVGPVSAVEEVKLSYAEISQWHRPPLFEPGKTAKHLAPLYLLKKNQASKEWAKCSSKATELARQGRYREIRHWLVTIQVHCALEWGTSDIAGLPTLSQRVAEINKERILLFQGPQSDRLLQLFLKAQYLLLDRDLKGRHELFWARADQLISMQDELSSDQKATLYQKMGEVSFIQQSLNHALYFWKQSVLFKSSSELSKRIESLEKPRTSTPEATPLAESESTESAPAEEAKPELHAVRVDPRDEQRAQIEEAIRGGNWIAAAEDGVAWLNRYPGHPDGLKIHSLLKESFFQLADQPGSSFHLIQRSFMAKLSDLAPDWLMDWMKELVHRDLYDEAIYLGDRADGRMKTDPRRPQWLYLRGFAAESIGRWKPALQAFEELAELASGSDELAHATLHSGWIHFHSKDYPKAAGFFEKYLSMNYGDRDRGRARYWLWRSLLNTKREDAGTVADVLAKEDGLSYYGLRAAAAMGNGVLRLDLPDKKPGLKSRIWLLPSQKKTWDRVQMLVQAGWWEEAQLELQSLPAPLDSEQNILMALVASKTLDYTQAFTWLYQSWFSSDEYKNKNFLQMIFPKEFWSLIATNAKKRNLHPLFVISLIRQESAYEPNATSSAEARGLMQLLPSTAKEVAGWLKKKNVNWPDDLYDPALNIELGTYYFSRLLGKYNGNIPLALAAYNAGPGRVDRWLKASPWVAELARKRSSRPEDEIWIEFLPWRETRLYVRRILRNYLIYRVLESGSWKFTDPVWSEARLETGKKD